MLISIFILRMLGAKSHTLPVDETWEIIVIEWDVPELGLIKCNVDGAVKLQDLKACVEEFIIISDIGLRDFVVV